MKFRHIAPFKGVSSPMPWQEVEAPRPTGYSQTECELSFWVHIANNEREVKLAITKSEAIELIKDLQEFISDESWGD